MTASLPQPSLSQLAPEICGDFDLRIRHDGTWLYRGAPIARAALVKLFASVLRREPDGSYWLVTPYERGRVAVDDAPFVAVDVDFVEENGVSRAVFRTNLDENVAAGPLHPITLVSAGDGSQIPHVMVRAGLEARVARAAFYRLVDAATTEGEHIGIWSDGIFFRLGDAA
jgi:uncharacterized protein